MMEEIMSNSNIWMDIYDTTDFGNKYASSYLVCLFHRRIKSLLKEHVGKDIENIKVLDFGCSLGANSRIFSNLGMETFGIDVSEKAIMECIDAGIGDKEHFKAVDLLDENKCLEQVFPQIKFDFIIASEVMYYFNNTERRKIIEQFYRNMNRGGVFYASMPTYDFSIYRKYKNVPVDEEGMVVVSNSGSISRMLKVNIPKDKIEMEDMYKPFCVLDILVTNDELFANIEEKEFHYIGLKN